MSTFASITDPFTQRTLLTLDCSSALEVCKPGKQVVVYGFSGCKYQEVTSAIYKSKLFEKVFDWTITHGGRTTSENRVIDDFCSGDEFKATLVDVVFENYERRKLGLAPLVVLFCADIDKNRFPFTAETLCSRDPNMPHHTHKEMRRAYKLCCEFENPEIRNVANETFKFVKLVRSKAESSAYEMQEIDAPWKSREWAEAWAKRKEGKVPRSRKSLCNRYGKTSDWRADLRKAIKKNEPSLCQRMTQSVKSSVSSFSRL